MEMELGTFIWSFINFFVLLAILNKLLYKPVLKMLAERKQTISESLASAEAAKVESIRLKAEYEQHLAEAKKEASEIIAQGSKFAEQAKSDILNKAKEESAKMVANAKDEIELEKNKAVAQLRNEVASLAILAAGKVLDKAVTNEDHKKLVDDFVKEVGGLPC